jgi:D-glycero-alpha-D-manno-heptose-7-phosphate kinase
MKNKGYNNVIVRARAPLRIGLAGGGSDVSPFCDEYGGCVVNATIDRYAYATIKPRSDSIVRFIASDKNIFETHGSIESMLDFTGLVLHRAVYIHTMERYNIQNMIGIDLITHCDAPEGSGLGSSSTLVVAMLKAFDEFFGNNDSSYGIAQRAFDIERIQCRMNGGRQDQYSAAFGGLNFMEFGPNNNVIVTPILICDQLRYELEASLLLYFTGLSRDSAKIISDQSSNVIAGNAITLEAMHSLVKEANITRNCLVNNNFAGFGESIRSGWESKKRSALSVTNPYIDQIYDAACMNGAISGKVSGAGGGGFMCFVVPCERRMDVIRVLKEFNGVVSNCHFVNQGVYSWRI